MVGTTYGCDYLDQDVLGATTYYYKIVAEDSSGNQSIPSHVKSIRGPLDKIVKDVTIFCGISIIILVVIYFIYEGSFFDKHAFVLNIDGKSTFAIDKLSGIINNNNIPPKLTIYGIDNASTVLVNSSSLTDNDGYGVIPLIAKLTNEASQSDNQAGNPREILLTVDKKDVNPGIFQGRIIVQDNKITSIPINLLTEPMIIQSVILVLIGTLVSVSLWEFINYFKKNNNEEQRNQLMDKASGDMKLASKQLDNYEQVKRKRDNSVSQFDNLMRSKFETQRNMKLANDSPHLLKPEFAAEFQGNSDHFLMKLDANLQEQIQELAAIRSNITTYDKIAEKAQAMASYYRASAEINKQAADTKTRQIENYKVRSLLKKSVWSKIIITEFASVLFGISIGIFGLLTNEYVMGLRDLGGVEIIVLFSLGLGIGSLKEFVDK